MGACVATRTATPEGYTTANKEPVESEKDIIGKSVSIQENSEDDHIFMNEREFDDSENKEYELNDNELELSEDRSSVSFDMNSFKHYKRHSMLSDVQLIEWIQSNTNEFIVIDVRHSDMDYLGGHIKDSINIDHNNFIKNITDIIERYYKIPNIVFHCMYSQCRAPMCCNWYCMAVTALLTEFDINNNDTNDTEQSFMNVCLSESGDFKVLYDVEMDKKKYDHLCKQNICVLNSGFANFVNKYRNDADLVVDFDERFWIQQQHSNTLIHKNDW